MSNPPGARPRKSRFVVDLERPAGAGRSSYGAGMGAERGGSGCAKGFMIVVAALLIILLAVGIGGFLWWRGYRSSPAYSLALLVDAAQRNDMEMLERHVDIERVATSFVPQVVEKARARAGQTGEMTASMREQVDAAIPRVLPFLRERVREEIARQAQAAGQRGVNVPFFLIALAVPYVVDQISEEGNAARVALHIGERPVELTLERSGERWKIVGVKDEMLAERIADEAISSAPANLPPDVLRQLPGFGDLLPQQRRGSRQQQQRGNSNTRRGRARERDPIALPQFPL